MAGRSKTINEYLAALSADKRAIDHPRPKMPVGVNYGLTESARCATNGSDMVISDVREEVLST